jgi:hypothetical protein
MVVTARGLASTTPRKPNSTPIKSCAVISTAGGSATVRFWISGVMKLPLEELDPRVDANHIDHLDWVLHQRQQHRRYGGEYGPDERDEGEESCGEGEGQHQGHMDEPEADAGQHPYGDHRRDASDQSPAQGLTQCAQDLLGARLELRG